ncbi:MAG: hypothetical protein QM777_10135 [Pseudorhodoferax sp.]
MRTSEASLAGLDQVSLSYAASDGVLSVPVKIVKADCSSAKAAAVATPPFIFETVLSRLTESPDTIRPLQIRLGLPAGKKPSVVVSAKGVEIIGARGVGKLPAGVVAKLDGGSLSLSTNAELKKPSDPYVIELVVRGLNHRATTSLTAKSNQAESKPITRELMVDRPSGEDTVAASAQPSVP